MNAHDLNDLLTGFRALEMGPQFAARYSGVDAVTGRQVAIRWPARMLRGRLLGVGEGYGVEVLALAQRVDGRFVAAEEVLTAPAGTRFWVVGRTGRAVEVRICAGYVEYTGAYGPDKCSPAQLTARKLRGAIAVIRVA